ncbi:hypothetical protein AXG93_402s1070 [Marchantia polymorpha subsp. ruderalis]|uniref:Uncharacterized protein n=1 Tax=Marchantia polymorpha subsp. ruderalis TaxID=1480154 RepID=A0A176WCN6_MARPO|nr:hypothetical protein AXG93_402s1070 [Marchantia polymorpha subsp. ruderalis]
MDGSAESAAYRTVRISERVVSSEARFLPMGMELGVPGDGPGVAVGEEPTSARLLTAPGEVASNATARAGGEGEIDQSSLPLLDQFLWVDGVLDSIGAVRRRANHEPSSQPKQKARKLVLPASSADKGRAAETRNSPSSEEDASAGVLGRSSKCTLEKLFPRTLSGGINRRLSCAFPVSVLAFGGLLHQAPSAETPSAQSPSAQTQLEQSAEDKVRKEETRVPSAQTPSAEGSEEEEVDSRNAYVDGRATFGPRVNAFGGELLCTSAFGASASRLDQRLRGKRLHTVCLRPNAFGGTDTCAFGGTELLRQKRLWGDKRDQQKRPDQLTTVNAFGSSAFGAAPLAMHLHRRTSSRERLRRCGSTLSAEDVRLRPYAFGAAGMNKVENRPEAKASIAAPSAIRLRRCANRATSTDDG